MHQGESFPVGKVDILHIYPMTYDEFLLAKGYEQMVDLLKKKDWETIKLLKSQYIKVLREYYFVGGMPEAVKCFIETNDSNQFKTTYCSLIRRIYLNIYPHLSPTESIWYGSPCRHNL